MKSEQRFTYHIGVMSIKKKKKAIPVKDWLEEGRHRFGPDPLNWRFQCPVCGRVYTVLEHMEAGSSGPNSAYQECIGRYLKAGPFNPKNGNKNGCDWCAFGLFGTVGKGQLVEAEDGSVVEVFQFAGDERK